jgi:hypothetical protein
MNNPSIQTISPGHQSERENYRLCFRFEYGSLDDGSLWIRTFNRGLYHVDWLTIRLLLELNAGASVTSLVNKYKVEAKNLRILLTNMEKEGSIVPVRQGKITRGVHQEDIHLSPFIFLFLFLGIIQINYFQSVAHTFRVKNWYEALLIGFFSILPITLHELGHYFVAKPYFKPRLGFTFLMFFPAIYLDTQSAWCLPRNIRLLINSAGLLMDLVFNTLMVFLVVYNPALEYYITPFLILQYTRWSIILNPLVNGDGYWLLADASRTVNLRRRGREELKKGKINWLSFYGLLSVIFSVFTLLGLAWFVINLLGKIIPF